MSKLKGFTLIEVTLFLAITALLFIGIAMGMQNSVSQQRYNDSTQNFLEFMRSIYSKVSNPQTVGDGNSDEAIYGKLVVFGEETDIDGSAVSGTPVFVYDVIGRADTVVGSLGTGSVKVLLERLNARVVRVTEWNSDKSVKKAELAAPEKYTPRWGAAIDGTGNGTPFAGSILVVRHPRSGTINTLFYGEQIDVNFEFESAKNSGNYDNVLKILSNKWDDFNGDRVINFCVNPVGANIRSNTTRQNIRILKNARNASDVEIIGLDTDDNACKENT